MENLPGIGVPANLYIHHQCWPVIPGTLLFSSSSEIEATASSLVRAESSRDNVSAQP